MLASRRQKAIGLNRIPCIRVEHLTNAQERAYRLADNRLAELAVWDSDLLAKELEVLTALDLDFSVEVTGFDTAEIDLIIEEGQRQQTPDPADEVPALVADRPAVARAGDLWQLGPHRLLCGDAREAQSFERLMDSEKAQIVFADPPYNVTIHGHVSGLGRVRHREFAMASGEMSSDEYVNFLESVCAKLVAFTADGSMHFICMDWRHAKPLLIAGERVYSELKNICVWNKDNGGMGSLYRSKHELVFVWKAGTAPHINNIELGRAGRYRTNVWDYPGVNSFRNSREDELAMHPTVKPVVPMPSETARSEAASCSIPLLGRVLRSSLPRRPVAGLRRSSLIRSTSIPRSGAGRPLRASRRSMPRPASGSRRLNAPHRRW